MKKFNDLQSNLKNGLLMTPFVVGTLAVSCFAEGGAATFTVPQIDVTPAINVLSTAFSTYAPPIAVAGVGFIAVKKGIGMIPKLIGMFFK